MKLRIVSIFSALLLTSIIATTAFAEDGELFVKNISKTPDLDTNHAALVVLYKNVLARNSSGDPAPVTYTAKDESEFTNDYVRPLIAMYHDGPVVNPEDSGEFPGHGQRDVFGAVSLDDGNTFKRSNLSNSGDKSSFVLKDHTTYYGDTFRLFANSAGTKVMAAWASRYANGGNPNYAMTDDDKEDLAVYLGIDRTDEVFDLYLDDIWGVSGSQGSSDFADEGFPTVGEVPYAALWTCRGTLEDLLDADGEAGTDGELDAVVWRQAERLTSGRRDVHRIEVGVAGGAGFVVTWQEDPDGLRPGTGEGPGEGWSGAVAHHETDIWYSYIDWDDFDLVDDGEEGFSAIPLAECDLTTTPAVAIPMSMPVRLTDNAMGTAMPTDYDPIVDPSYLYELDQDVNGESDLCASTVTATVETPNGSTELEMCVAQDGRLMRGNTGATRNRVNLRGYDTDDDGVFDEAWVVMAYEESKGLGEELDYDPGELIEKVDMGKNIWYHSFDMRNPELVSQGLMLNMPAVYPADLELISDISTSRLVEYPESADSADGNITYDYRFMHIEPDPIYEEQPAEAIETTLLQCEIARRFSLISQPAKDAGPSGTVALGMWKQGIIRQGGPADVYGRRFIIPEDFDAAVDNPFGYDAMECGTWLFEDGSNPRYVKGLCISPPEALSAGMPFDQPDGEGEASSMGNVIEDLIAEFPFNLAFDDIDMEQLTGDQLPKVYEWQQLGANYGEVITNTALTNLDDQSWENPYDVAKGHRGFISGDFIMLLYAWSPNWLANTWGHDNYNLYVRRSFDGGDTWTTLPDGWTDTQDIPETTTLVADGTAFYEWMGPAGGETEYKVEFVLGAGEFEPTRSMSMLNGLKETVLDPRYAPTGGPTHSSIFAADGITIDDPNDDGESERDPSKYFITFEVGDNTQSEFGEAPPQDMYYSRATNYGDDYEYVWDDDAPLLDGVPTYDLESDKNEGYFDWLEGKEETHAAEASMHASPGGKFFWAVWEQWTEDELGEVHDTDAPLRRLMFLEEEIVDDSEPNKGPGEDSGPGGDFTPPGKR